MEIVPKLSYKEDKPWTTVSPALSNEISDYFQINNVVTKTSAGLLSFYEYSEDSRYEMGIEYTNDKATSGLPPPGNVYWNGKSSVEYNNTMLFVQSYFNTSFSNLSLGLRYESHNQYGDVYLPRLALTKKIKSTNIKLIYNRAFRAPAMANIEGNFFLNQSIGKPVIEPEITNVYDLEISHQFSPNYSLTANLFKIDMDQTITFVVKGNGNSGYENRGKSGTEGIELMFKTKHQHSFINLNYSYYTSNGINKVPDFTVPGNSCALLSAPQHKISLLSGYSITDRISVNPSFVYLGDRYGYTQLISGDNYKLEKFSPIILANLVFNFDNYFLDGVFVGIGVYNVFNESQSFIQPYNGGHPPLPGPSRELLVKLSYRW